MYVWAILKVLKVQLTGEHLQKEAVKIITALKVVQPSMGKYGQTHLRTNHFNSDVVE
jgi:hypothetical protein